MRRTIAIVMTLIGSMGFMLAQDSIKVYGRVTDFNQLPLDSVTVYLKDKTFSNLYSATTDKNGKYSMTIKKGKYNCLYAIKLSDYGKTKLEYWAWNVPAFQDLEINPQYERMEIYGVNAFEPQVTPYETYMIYFRPMSLTKSLKFTNLANRKELEKKASVNKDTINIAPDYISKEELNVSVNNIPAEVLCINKISENARGAIMYAYSIQIKKPKSDVQMPNAYDKITIILHSKETGEYGKGEYFLEKKQITH